MREYIAAVVGELQKIRAGNLAIMDKNLIPVASTDESKVLYYKMQSDFYRYLADCATSDAKGNAAEGACVAHAEATKTSSRDRISQYTVEQSLDVPVSEIVKQLVEVLETVSQDRIQQRTVEQIVDAPVPKAVEELAEVFRVFSQDRIQQRAVEQTTPATSLSEMIVEVPVVQTQGRTQQGSIQSKSRGPKIIKEAVQRKKPIIQKEIKHPEVPRVQFPNKVDEMPVGVQRQISMVQVVQKTTKIPQLQCVDEAIDGTVVQVPRVQVVEKTVEGPQLQIVEQIVETPETQTIQSTQTSESLGGAPVRVAEVRPTGVVKPGDPDAKIKFFAAEALHGVHGNRLANELGRRACVTGEM